MYLNSNKMFFYFILFFSTLISISSNSWLGCWIGLEINLLSFIPIILNPNNMLSSESSMKYFMTQALASINLLFMILMNMIFMKIFELNNLLSLMINSALLMKMGAAPFHFWFPIVMDNLTWMNCLILMTWQKITPMILLSYYFNMNFLFIIVMITSIVGAIGGLNQSSLKKLLTFSSINHLGWMIMAIMISETLWNFYFLIYSFMMMLLCLMFKLLNSLFINQLFFNNMNKLIKLFLSLNLLSLGGLPPFLGFLPKWIMINFFMQNNMFIILFTLIMTALITLFFYIRIIYSSFMFNYLKLKWYKIYMKSEMMNLLNFFSFITLFSLIFSTFFYYS